MNLGRLVLRLLFPEREQERMVLRREMLRNQAHAEELTRTLQNGGGEALCAHIRRIKTDD